MRKLLVGSSLAVLVLTAAGSLPAQQPAGAAAIKLFADSAEVQALMAKAKAEIKPGQPMFSQRLVNLAPYAVNLEYRVSAAPASIHEKEAEIFFVVEGSGILTTGGKLVKQSGGTADNPAATVIEGGTSQSVSKGEVLIVPENTPHWYGTVNAPGPLVLMSMHMPRTTPAAQ